MTKHIHVVLKQLLFFSVESQNCVVNPVLFFKSQQDLKGLLKLSIRQF